MTQNKQLTVPAEEVKSCCANVYESDWARLLLGDSFHPGGLALTERLGELLGLSPGKRVLDVAAGKGASAIFLARRFGCEVVGVDYSGRNVAEAVRAAEEAGVDDLVSFRQGDAECLPFGGGEFDGVVCECAYCTFPDKAEAAREFQRVLRPGGRVGLSDLTRAGEAPPELRTLLAWVACLSDARPVEEYAGHLESAGFMQLSVEPHDEALAEMARGVRAKLLGAELMAKIGKLTLPVGDLDQAKQMARVATSAVEQGRLGYTLLTAVRE
jgi:SAM-dependent methyltransferase